MNKLKSDTNSNWKTIKGQGWAISQMLEEMQGTTDYLVVGLSGAGGVFSIPTSMLGQNCNQSDWTELHGTGWAISQMLVVSQGTTEYLVVGLDNAGGVFAAELGAPGWTWKTIIGQGWAISQMIVVSQGTTDYLVVGLKGAGGVFSIPTSMLGQNCNQSDWTELHSTGWAISQMKVVSQGTTDYLVVGLSGTGGVMAMPVSKIG